MEETVKEETKVKKKPSQKEVIESLEEEIKALKEQVLRAHAEFDNTKKRLEQQRIQDRKYASKFLVEQLISPLSQLDKIVEMKTEDTQLKNFLIGFRMVKDALYKVLESDGLKHIEALDQPYDPNIHEAIEKVEDRNKPKSINIEVVSKGYMYKDQLLRPAMVKINEWSDENGENK